MFLDTRTFTAFLTALVLVLARRAGWQVEMAHE